MGTAPDWEEGELEFKLVFEEDPPRGPSPCRLGERPDSSTDGFQSASHTGQPIGIPAGQPSTNLRAGMHSPPPRRALVREYSGTYESLPARSIQVSESRILECPSIQITTISPEEEYGGGSCWDGGGGWDRERLYLPLQDPFCYREGMTGGGSLSPSPASSPSSRGWLSPASSCDSLLVEEEELNEATAQFGLSPSSRPTSPGGKKRRNSPLASPCTSRRGSYSEEYPCSPQSSDSVCQNQASPGCLELNIPQKTRKTSLGQVSPREVESDQAPPPGSTCPLPDSLQSRRDPSSLGMDYLCVPPALGWGRARASAHSPIFRSTALPPLDWPLPSQFDQYELRIEVQPRPHHRAHYETEGSRGAVKATPSGHPVVKLLGYTERQPLSLQVFVGTADDRSIRPHPFYQIHRVTGKMVGTASQESIQAGTKLLDIPLNPETNMTALIDCAGILKLRNSDIELRKGETDVGRKNTRVRLVFRTHLPLAPPTATPTAPPGRVLALQVASLPIECSQRSAQELPVVESISLSSCSVEGGEELLLSGANYLTTSRVIFMERGTDGKLQWEEEACVNRDKSSECLLSVRVPAYSDLSAIRPVSVSLYVSNGKRKRSSTHCFKYLPVMFKQEDPLSVSHRIVVPLDGVTLCPVGGLREAEADGILVGGDCEDGELGLVRAYPPPSLQGYREAEGLEEGPDRGGALSERNPSLENLELGFTELLPPLYPRNPQTPSPCPWLDSPYLSSSPSPSCSSSLSPFPASSPHTSTHSLYSSCPYPPEICPSPPRHPSPYQDFYTQPCTQFEGWEPQGGGPAGRTTPGSGAPTGVKMQESALDYAGPSAIQQITLEEVSEFIGEDFGPFPREHSRP
ncbi:nuclear factor of activated T-cells, cytoplasmic 4 [Anguilla rostrata]|uniref:nuclear factor of activated T-cells, cytoplasmic 4 n=1 Tax=Anguilla rostrata TaxID=7938 RepID=UPI0030D58948